MTLLTVNTSVQLLAALKAAKGGETIVLKAGSYDKLTLTNKSFAADVTIKSADASHPAVLNGVTLNGVDHLKFDGVVIQQPASQAGNPAARAFNATNSKFIEVTNSEVRGSVDGRFDNDGIGLSFLKSADVSVTNTKFHDLFRGAVFDDVRKLKVSGNAVYDIRSDGFNFSETREVLVESNTFGQFRSAATNGMGGQGVIEHPGIIQFWTNGATKANENIVIRGNVSLQSSSDGFPVGGIFMRDENGNLPYRNVLIEKNLIYTRDADTITVGHGIGVVIRDNTVLSVPGATEKASINVWDRSSDVRIENNIAMGILERADSPIGKSGNVIAQWTSPGKPGYYGDLFVNAFGAKTVADLMAVPGSAAEGKGAEIPVSDLAGGSGKGWHYGGPRDDTMAGGAGDDTFVFTPNGGGNHDTVTGFMAGAGTPDKLLIAGFAGAFSASAILAKASQVGADTVLVCPLRSGPR